MLSPNLLEISVLNALYTPQPGLKSEVMRKENPVRKRKEFIIEITRMKCGLKKITFIIINIKGTKYVSSEIT